MDQCETGNTRQICFQNAMNESGFVRLKIYRDEMTKIEWSSLQVKTYAGSTNKHRSHISI